MNPLGLGVPDDGNFSTNSETGEWPDGHFLHIYQLSARSWAPGRGDWEEDPTVKRVTGRG